MFDKTQIAQLKANLDGGTVKTRKQGYGNVSYVEGWHVINEANRIFGFDCWHRETFNLVLVNETPVEVGKDKAPGWAVTYICQVRVQVDCGDNRVIRVGTGTGHGRDRDKGQAHESAVKEAETDAMKRALITFGNPFGLALYDKDQAHVSAPGSEDSEPRSTTEELIEELKQCESVEELGIWGERNAERCGRAIGTKARIREAYQSHLAELKIIEADKAKKYGEVA